ncbi:hypothetical protein D3C80_2121420 [compost metagenome]
MLDFQRIRQLALVPVALLGQKQEHAGARQCQPAFANTGIEQVAHFARGRGQLHGEGRFEIEF